MGFKPRKKKSQFSCNVCLDSGKVPVFKEYKNKPGLYYVQKMARCTNCNWFRIRRGY